MIRTLRWAVLVPLVKIGFPAVRSTADTAQDEKCLSPRKNRATIESDTCFMCDVKVISLVLRV